MAALARLSVGRHLGPTHDSLGDSLDRRSFFDTLTTLGMFGGLRGALPFAGTIEDQSRLGKGQHLETIGIQLYSVRRELARDFEGTLARVASIGYREVEFAGYFDRRPKQVKAILDRYRLAA